MKKNIIVKSNADTREKLYLKGNAEDFKWVKSPFDANHYDIYDVALLDWSYACRWYNPNGDRIFIALYDPDSPPWE